MNTLKTLAIAAALAVTVAFTPAKAEEAHTDVTYARTRDQIIMVWYYAKLCNPRIPLTYKASIGLVAVTVDDPGFPAAMDEWGNRVQRMGQMFCDSVAPGADAAIVKLNQLYR
jgi:hypothetical protein